MKMGQQWRKNEFNKKIIKDENTKIKEEKNGE
jgi:hypothetical protein